RLRIDDLPGVEETFGVEEVLDLAHHGVEVVTEDTSIELTADEPVPMFARVHTPEGEHELEHLLRDSLHDGCFFRNTEVDERPEVEAPAGAVPVEARPEPVALQDLAERRDVVDEPVRWYRGVFDERQRPSRPGARRHQ